MIKIKYFCYFFILTFISCSSGNNIAKPDNKQTTISKKSIFNYEDTSSFYVIENINNHYLINIEIEEPYIINFSNVKIDKIYCLANIEGTAVFYATFNDSGNIISVKLIKSAGLGLDKNAESIVRSIKISPSYIRGTPDKTEIKIKIRFRSMVKI